MIGVGRRGCPAFNLTRRLRATTTPAGRTMMQMVGGFAEESEAQVIHRLVKEIGITAEEARAAMRRTLAALLGER